MRPAELYQGNAAQRATKAAADFLYALDKGFLSSDLRFLDGTESAFIETLREAVAEAEAEAAEQAAE